MMLCRPGWRGSRRRAILVFLSIDAEPDGFQLSRSEPPAWTGYGATLEIVERLRSDTG